MVSFGSQADTDAAVAAARSAFPSWAQTALAQRVALLERLVEVYTARLDEMAAAISLEMGAPISMSRTAQASFGVEHLKASIEALKEFTFDRPLGDHALGDRILHEPIGVCALIAPWNWPMFVITDHHKIPEHVRRQRRSHKGGKAPHSAQRSPRRPFHTKHDTTHPAPSTTTKTKAA